jgi:hypothetical protein
VTGKKVKLPLSESHPDLANEAVGWDPSSLTRGSKIKVRWKCSLAHEWETTPLIRSNGSGCPFCGNKRLLPGFNDFQTNHPAIADEAVGWDPSLVFSSDKKNREWLCKSGHVWSGSCVFRVAGSATCPYCRGRKAIVGENDLKTLYPQLAMEADGWDPTQERPGSRTKAKWKCQNGHNWTAIISSRVKGRGCPFCSGRRVIEGETDLETKFPNIAKEADGWDPRKIHHGSPSSFNWKCSLGHKWRTAPAHRTRNNTGCPICGNDIALKGFNDIGITHPEIAKEAFNWDPSTVVAGSHKVRQWKCKKGHIYSAPVHQRALSGGGCSFCSGQKTLLGFNDIATLNPLVASEANGWDPKLYVMSSHKIVSWKCSKGHVWNARIFSRATNGLGCPICAGKEILVGFNDLKTTHPQLAAEAVGWDTTRVSRGSQVKRKWRCDEGHEWIAYVHSRSAGFGCPTCAKSGFDPNSEAWLYFLFHPNWQMLQIGITNFPDDRLKSHNKLGWEILETRGPMDGHLTQQWETAILRMLKAQGADLSNSQIAGKFDGYSEAWSKSSFEANSIKELMRLTEEFEEMDRK